MCVVYEHSSALLTPETFCDRLGLIMFRNGELAPPDKGPRSDVWKYFVYSERRRQSSCTVGSCPRRVVPGRKTSHLRRHLELEHPAIYGMVMHVHLVA